MSSVTMGIKKSVEIDATITYKFRNYLCKSNYTAPPV